VAESLGPTDMNDNEPPSTEKRHDPGFLNIAPLSEGYMYSYSEIGSLPPLIADVKIRGVGVQIVPHYKFVRWIEHCWRFYIYNTSYEYIDYGTSTG